ncbi:phage tail tape measure protein [Bacillus sp. FSL P4-0290]|uniref:phage tail tape measure protein n=2 Tax=Bacillus sp. FSL P4-0290 TaxID=2921574 RepID=UPI0030D36A53
MAESLGSLRVSIGLESADLTRGLADINRKLGALNSEFKATMAGAGKFDNSLDTLNQKANVLNRTLQVHKAKLTDLKRQYEESVRTKGKDAAASVKLLTQYNKALAAMRKTEDQLDLVNKRIKEQSTGFAQLGAKLNASVNTITTKMRALDAAFKASTAGVDNFGSTSDQLRQKADHLNKSIDLQQQRLKDLRRLYLESKRAKGEDAQETQELSARMNEATAQLRETQAQLRATNTQIEQQANAWHRMGTQAQESGENLRTVGGNLQSIGSEIATSFGAATLAVGGALGLATKKSMDFEQQMSNVKSVMNPEEANKYSDALTNLAVKLGADTKYSALEAAQGMEELVKAGVTTQDIINGGLSGALSLATAGGLELADAAEIASTALNAFKDDNLSVAQAADILAGAANSSATDVQEMKYGLSMTSAVAAGMGLTFKDTATALAVFAQNGLKGSDAGTSLKTMLSRLVPMTKAQYESMSDLGLVTLDTTEAYKRMAEKGFKPATKDLGDIYDALNKYVAKTSGAKEGTDKFSKAFDKATRNLGIMDNKFFDANGNIRSMTEISGELSKALDGMSAKDKQEALYNIFGSDAIRGALILGKEGSKGFTAMAKAMDKIKAADVAAERMNNLKGRIEELSGAFETAQINIGKALTPVVSALVAVLQKVVDAFNNLSPGMQKFVAITLAATAAILGVITVLGVLLAGIGGALVGLGSLQIAWGLLSVQIAAAGGMMGIFTSILAALTSPISLTIAGIAALVTVFVLVYKHSEQLQKLLGVVFNAIKAGALVAYNGAKVAFDGIVAAVLPVLVQGFTSLLPIILNVVQAVFPVALSLIQAIVPIIQMIATQVLPILLSAVQAIFPAVLTIIQAALPIVVAIIKLLATVIKDLVTNVLPLVLSVVQAVFPVVLAIIQAAVPVIIAILKGVAIIIQNVVIPAIRFILQVVQIVFPVIVGVIQGALNLVTNIIKLFSSVLKGDWQGVWNAVLGILKSVWTIIGSVIQGAVNLVLLAVTTAWNLIKSVTSSVFNAIWGFLKSIWNSIWGTVKNLAGKVVDGVVSAWNSLWGNTKNFFKRIKDFAVETFDKMVSNAKALPGKIGDGIKNMAGKAVDGVKALGNKMIGGFEGIVNGLTQKGINKVLGLIGVDKKHYIPKLEIPRYAKGTSAGGHPGGPAILGDGGGPELFRTPSGFTGLSPGRDTLFNLPKGTQVIPHDMTKKLIAQGIPAYNNGTKKKNLFEQGVDAVSGAKDKVVNVAKGAVNKVKEFAFDVWDYVSDPEKLISKVVGSLGLKLPEISGVFGNMAKGAYEKVKSSMVGFVKKQIDDFGGGFGSGEKATGNVKQWIRKAMEITKVPSNWFGPLTTMAMKESGGRTGPSTINKWDINWKRGTPSMGLMQTIRTTFDSHKMKGMGDIMNPVHNAVAAIRYIISRYRTVFNTPGIKSMRAGGPYKGYKIGDIVTQKQLAWVAEEGPEAVIPLQNNRQRAIQLWKSTGDKLGVSNEGQSVALTAQLISLLEKQNAISSEQLNATKALGDKDTAVYLDGKALDNRSARIMNAKKFSKGVR